MESHAISLPALPNRPCPYLAGLGIASIVFLMGCGESEGVHPPTYEATGTVTYNGNPVEGAHVTYRSTGEPVYTAYGTTNADGQFRLTTFEKGDGAVEGSYAVKIMKLEEKSAESDPGSVPPGGPTAAPPPPKSLIPERYSNFDTSGFSATVSPDGTNQKTFDLTD